MSSRDTQVMFTLRGVDNSMGVTVTVAVSSPGGHGRVRCDDGAAGQTAERPGREVVLAAGAGEGSLTLMRNRVALGDGDTVTATIQAVPTAYMMGSATSASASIAGNADTVRHRNVEHALGGFARSIGWVVVDAFRAREFAAEDGQARQRMERDGGFSGWRDARFRTSVKHDHLSFSPESRLGYDGTLTSVTLAIEQALGDKGLLGVAASWFGGEFEFDDGQLGVEGSTELTQWALTPYLALATDSVRLWGAISLGGGSLDYKDERGGTKVSSSSSAKMNVLAAGFEYDLFSLGSVDVAGRIEGMSAELDSDDGDDDLYDSQSVRVHGARGEFEFAWPMMSRSGWYRPYLTAGYRWDGGDGEDESAFEYGGGLEIRLGRFSLVNSIRSQGRGDSDDYDRKSHSISLAHDFAVLKLPVGGEGVLTPFVSMSMDSDDASEWNLGMAWANDFGSVNLTHTARLVDDVGGVDGDGGSRGRDQHEARLEFKFDF